MVLIITSMEKYIGLQHISYKAKAPLIATLSKTAVNPRYISSKFNTALYKVHMLEEQEGVPSS